MNRGIWKPGMPISPPTQSAFPPVPGFIPPHPLMAPQGPYISHLMYAPPPFQYPPFSSPASSPQGIDRSWNYGLPIPDSNGWYTSGPPHLSRPVPMLPPPPPGFAPREHSGKAQPHAEGHNPFIHAFWRNRLAPLPGYRSPHDLLQVVPPKRAVAIRDPEKANNQEVRDIPAEVSENAAIGYPSPTSSTHSAELDRGDNKESKDLLRPLDRYVRPTDIWSRAQVFRAYLTLSFQADIFVPQYLQDIQQQPHNFEPLQPTPVFPSKDYASTFLPTPLLHPAPQPTLLLSAPHEEKVPALESKLYHRHFLPLLQWELARAAEEKSLIVLWKAPVIVSNWANAEFCITVPGIRENHPRLEVGDLVHLREIVEHKKSGSGVAFEARVITLRKREGIVNIYCPAIKRHILTYVPYEPGQLLENGIPTFTSKHRFPFQFNITFLANGKPLIDMDSAVARVQGALTEDARNLADQWLFPEPSDLDINPAVVINSNTTGHNWVDQGLNDEQRMAASYISRHQSPIPFLISGPPGTGKTRTVVESVNQILALQPHARIILCAPSNPATDTLATRLASSGVVKPHEMLRLNDENRTFAEVPDAIRGYCYVEHDKFGLPPWEKLMRYRVIVTSCLDAGILLAAQCSNSSITALETYMMGALHPTPNDQPPRPNPHWTHLIIDEAAQGSEPELLIPISLVIVKLPVDADPPEHAQGGYPSPGSPIARRDVQSERLALCPQLVLCGDPNQLGPIISSDEARTHELDMSLLERLFERPVYALHPKARGSGGANQLPSISPPPPGLPIPTSKYYMPFVNLVRNYRSHPAILMPPSAMFYNDSLIPSAANGRISWSGMLNPDMPLVFIGCSAPENCIDERSTWFNRGEIDETVLVVQSLMRDANLCTPPLRTSEIGVMAPWREQVWKLREKLREAKLSAVDVGSVEDYQGRESRVVIISCVRSNPRFLPEDQAKGLGLIYERKRMNVSITRARELLVVIGNAELLKLDPYWKSFLQFVIRNNLYVGAPPEIEMDGNYVSRLESQYISSQQENGAVQLGEEEQGVLIAGSMARELLKE